MVTEATTAADIERLEVRSDFRGGDEIGLFLTQNPSVVSLLLEALDHLPSYFAPEAPLALELVYDHEDEDDPGDLYAIIRTPLEPEQAMPLFDRFADEWWREELGHVDRFAFSLEYV